jgi:hypothetical protein
LNGDVRNRLCGHTMNDKMRNLAWAIYETLSKNPRKFLKEKRFQPYVARYFPRFRLLNCHYTQCHLSFIQETRAKKASIG